MKSLLKLAAIDIGVDGVQLGFGPEVTTVEPACRMLAAAKYAFLDETVDAPEELYYMYRDVACTEDRAAVERSGVRYDVTVILPGCVGPEYIKTVGHYHPVTPGSDMTYPEGYEVLSGEATYLLQRPGLVSRQPPAASRQEAICAIDDVYAVVARPGDKVVIPPGYGHITINAGSEPLVMANWVAAEFESVYGAMRELKGGAYYLLSSGEWVKNPLYGQVPQLRFEKVREYAELGLISGVGMYGLIRQAPEKLRFLTHPVEFSWGSRP